jgi:hypothetical protein
MCFRLNEARDASGKAMKQKRLKETMQESEFEVKRVLENLMAVKTFRQEFCLKEIIGNE